MKKLRNVSTKELKKFLNDLLEIMFDDDLTEHEKELIRDDIREIRTELFKRN